MRQREVRRSQQPPQPVSEGWGEDVGGRHLRGSGMRTLLLSDRMTPLRIISWERAYSLVMSGKVDVLEVYEADPIRTPRGTLPRPAVLRLHTVVPRARTFKFKRKRVFARDNYSCCYCGDVLRRPDGTPDRRRLTIDHVVPRSIARKSGDRVSIPSGEEIGVTSWQNVLTACPECNHRKGSKTLESLGLKPLRQPEAPTSMTVVRMAILASNRPSPPEWSAYLPDDDLWRGIVRVPAA